MATYTTHYNLTKPGLNDLVDVEELNDNFDAIDAAIHDAAQSGGTATGMIETSTEASATSAHAYAVGEHFIYNDVLYKATAAIAIGDTIASGTNCQPVTVAGELENVQESLVFDDAPTEGSSNPVKSGGIYTALGGKVDKNGTDRLMTAAEGTKLGALPTNMELQSALNGKLSTSAKGQAGGVAELDANGQVPSSQLPSYVDSVEEYATLSAFPATGESGKIYVALDTNKTYRWGSTTYVEISSSLALGETASTAYRGDRGKAAYDHSLVTSGNPHHVTKANVGLGNVDNTSDANKPVSTAQQTALDLKAPIADVQAGTEAKKAYHMGFYIGADGGLCQSDDEI